MTNYSIAILLLYMLTIASVFLTRFVTGNLGYYFAVLLSVISFGLAGSRPSHFPDLGSYEVMFEVAAIGNFSDPSYWISHGEPLFKVFSFVISYLGVEFSGFLLIIAGLSWYLLMLISRIAGVSFTYLWFAYFSFFFITRDMGVIRVAIAAHLIVIFFLLRGIFAQYLILILSSLTFQYFSVVAVLAKVFAKFEINWVLISILLLLGPSIFLFFSYEDFSFLLAEETYRDYSSSISIQAGGSAALIPVIRNLIIATFIWYFYRNNLGNKQIRVWVWSAFFSLFFYVSLIDVLLLAQRFSAYFGAVVPLAMAFLMERKSHGNNNFYIVIIFCIFNFTSLFYFNNWIWM